MATTPGATGRRRARAIALVGAALLLGLPPARAAELLTADGRTLSGDPQLVDGGAIAMRGQKVPLDRVVALRWPGRAIAGQVMQGAVLADGDVIAGQVGGLQAGTLALRTDIAGEASIPAAMLRAVLLQPVERGVLAGAADGAPGAVLANGDLVAGNVTWINREKVGIDTGKRIMAVARDRVALVRLAAPAVAVAESRQTLRLASGERLRGRLTRLDARGAELDHPVLRTLALEAAAVVELASEGGPLLPLSLLPPAEFRHVPQFDERFGWDRDRNLGGGELAIGGRPYGRGIACHSRAELTWDVTGWKAFVAEIGIDDHARGRGAVDFAVLLDGAEALRKPMSGGDAAQPVHVPLRNAKRMTLLVDFGADGSSSGDHADWARAVLVK